MRWGAVVVAVALGLSACSTTPAQAPLHDAKILNDTTGNISTACGEASQLAAFPGAPRADELALEATAATAARKLAAVFRLDPRWQYLGESVGQVVSDANALLGTCGLTQAQHALQQAIRR